MSRSAGESMRSIAARMDRHPCTISRELARNSGRDGRNRASSAHVDAILPDGEELPLRRLR